MEYSTIEIDVDSDIFKQAQSIFEKSGLDVSSAVNFFLEQCVREQRIPLDYEVPNAETIAAMEEIEEMIRNGDGHGFSSAEEMFNALGI